MKRILLLAGMFMLLFSTLQAADQIDLTKKPEPLAKKEFPFPKFSETKLKNGIKVFVIEDHEQPTFSIRVLLPGGISVEGKKAGVADMTAQLLTKGAGKRSALDIANALDGVGASVSASASIDYISLYGSSLKKHLPLVMEIMSDVILKPTFPDEEFEKLVPQILAGLQHEKSQPGAIGAALAKKVLYGEDHPYAAKQTEKSVKSIELDDIKEYFRLNFKPNNVTIAVVGDFTQKEIIPILEKAFSGWTKSEMPAINVPAPKPMPIGVYFVKRPASVQSTIILTTKTVPFADQNYETIDIASDIIGAGFAGRLFRTLRETHSYTYTPFGYQTSSKYVNRFACGADVRNSVTDSAIDVIKEQLRLLGTEPASESELSRIKRYTVGQYLMSFENSQFVSGLIQNSDFQGVPLSKVKDYPDRIMKMNPYEIKDMAARYLNPDNAYIVVVGSPDVIGKLEKYGKVYQYDLDLNPVTGENAKMEKVSLDANDIIRKYTEAVGGKAAIDAVKSVSNNGKVTLTMQGQTMPGTYVQKIKAPNMSNSILDIAGSKQTMITNGTSAWVITPQGILKQEGKDLDKAIFDATLFNVTKINDYGFKATVLGKQAGKIIMKVSSPNGMESTFYFDEKSFMLTTIESINESPEGPMPVVENYGDYVKVGNVMMPGTIETVMPMFTIKVENSYEVNVPVDDSVFSEPKSQN